VVYHERAKRVEWRCGELDPGPRMFMKVNLRRIVSVRFKAGCEERRRNHSYSIPYLDAPAGTPSIDPTDNSAPISSCENTRDRDVARRRAVRLSRKRTRSHSYRSMATSRLQECSWQVCFPVSFKCWTGVHCVARLSKNRPSKPVTPRKHMIPSCAFCD